MKEWETFFVAHLGAAAVLAGLLFVSISLNLTRILSMSALPSRALVSLSLLFTILVVSSFMLLPYQSARAIGFEVLLVAVLLWIGGTRLAVNSLRNIDGDNRQHFLVHLVLFQVAALPYIAGAVLLLLGMDAGLYWIAAAILLSVFVASFDAWVLLVEINR